MQQLLSLRLKPLEAGDHSAIVGQIAAACGKDPSSVSGFHILKQSLDARGSMQWIILSVRAFINEPFTEREALQFHFCDVTRAKKKVLIAGAGPAGLFAALQLLELGIQPILLERGSDVRTRRRDLAALNRQGILNAESNYCFGEGGAGTYSDGKLYTRSRKRGDIDRILNLFTHFGADPKILYEAHPHIGTNKLPQIISAMRACITGLGGAFHLNKKLTGLIVENNKLKAVNTEDGEILEADALILATGHSARDIFTLLHAQGLAIESKAFALGVRVEHPQDLIDRIQYKCPAAFSSRPEGLPPAAYALNGQVNGRGVFSFCMCPGGIIAPAATEHGGLVVNGWSPSKRDNPFANSGMVTEVSMEEVNAYFKKNQPKEILPENHPLQLMAFQRTVEQDCFSAGGGNYVAPAQRLTDFVRGKISRDLPESSYHPGITSRNLGEVLPRFIFDRLAAGLSHFGKKMRGYLTEDAVVVATESRTSSPVRIPRNPETLCHPQVMNLYPCGEGAGYAGGIVSAAMDGERVARMCAMRIGRPGKEMSFKS